MSDNREQIAKVHLHYSEKAQALKSSLAGLKNKINTKGTPEDRLKFADLSRSKLGTLYTNLAKNAASVVTLGEEYFPKLKHSFSGKNHEFSSSPNFSEEFNKSVPALKALSRINLNQEIENRDGGIVNRHPCLLSTGAGQTMHEFLENKSPKDDLSGINEPKIDEHNLNTCTSLHCLDCPDCIEHQNELINSINGAVSHDPETGDGMRSMHIKNMITTLGNWATHMDSRGNDRDTFNRKDYSEDGEKHAKLGTSLRMMAHRLGRAYELDYNQTVNPERPIRYDQSGTSLVGGGIHRDHFGTEYGEDRETY